MFEEETGEWIDMPLWSPEGDRIALFGTEYVSIYNVSTGELLQRFQGGAFAGQWLSGGYLILGNTEGIVHVYDIEKGVAIMAYEIGGGLARPVVSPDQSQMIVASNNGALYLFDLWLTPDELIAEANECCMVHTLTPEEREIFGLPPLEE
jgi:hypothetical protein